MIKPTKTGPTKKKGSAALQLPPPPRFSEVVVPDTSNKTRVQKRAVTKVGTDLGHLRPLRCTWLGKADDHSVNDSDQTYFPKWKPAPKDWASKISNADYNAFWEFDCNGKDNSSKWTNLIVPEKEPLPETRTLRGFGGTLPPAAPKADDGWDDDWSNHVPYDVGEWEEDIEVTVDSSSTHQDSQAVGAASCSSSSPSVALSFVACSTASRGLVTFSVSCFCDASESSCSVVLSYSTCSFAPRGTMTSSASCNMAAPVPFVPAVLDCEAAAFRIQFMWKLHCCMKRWFASKLLACFPKMTVTKPFSAIESGRLRMYTLDEEIDRLKEINESAHPTAALEFVGECVACWETEPYCSGGFRHAFRGGTFEGSQCGALMLKRFRDDRGLLAHNPTASVDEIKDAMTKEMLSQKIAQHYADAWSCGTFNQINIVEPFLVCPLNEKGEEMDVWMGEQVICGEYKKWIHNSGRAIYRGDAGDAVAQAFAHFSWDYSKGKHLVCDIQGSCRERITFGDPICDLTLTDPVVATGGSAGEGADHGQKAIDRFFTEHVCNRLCTNFAKPAAFTPVFAKQNSTQLQPFIPQPMVQFGEDFQETLD